MINMPYKDIKKRRKYDREWKKKNRASYRRYWRNMRKKVIEKLGVKCVYCGCDEYEALEINHINGKGGEESREKRKTFHLNILSGRRKTDDLELTCGVCNKWHYLTKLKGLPDNWEIKWKKAGVGNQKTQRFKHKLEGSN